MNEGTEHRARYPRPGSQPPRADSAARRCLLGGQLAASWARLRAGVRVHGRRTRSRRPITAGDGVVVLLCFAPADEPRVRAFGTFAGAGTGSASRAEPVFPLFFVFLFISSMKSWRNLIGVTWSATREREPSRSARVSAQHDHHRLRTARRSRSVVGIAATARGQWRSRVPRARPGRARAVRSLVVARAVARRTLHNVFHNPRSSAQIVLPLFFFTARGWAIETSAMCPASTSRRDYTASSSVRAEPSAESVASSTGFGIGARLRERLRASLILAAPHTHRIVLGYDARALTRGV